MSQPLTKTKGLSSATSESRANSDTDDNKSHDSKAEARKSRFSDKQKATDVSVVRTRSLWDVAPGDATPKRFGETPLLGRFNNDATPLVAGETPTPRKFKSNWDSKTPVNFTPQTLNDATPTSVPSRLPQFHNIGTPAPNQYGLVNNLTPERIKQLRWEKELEERNRPLADEELDEMIKVPGYEVCFPFASALLSASSCLLQVVKPPADYKPVVAPGRRANPSQSPFQAAANSDGQVAPASAQNLKPLEIPGTPQSGPGALPAIKPEDLGYFGALLQPVDERELPLQEQKERKIMMLLLKIKNGTPPMRKSALRTITEKAREFGPAALFNQILPLLMSPTLEDQERHLLVKVIDRVMYKLDDLVRNYVHKILAVIEPLLIDEDYYARVEGREIISNLAKAAGKATMITAMRPDIDHPDEIVRNTTARAFAVVASALGIPSLLPFLKAVCQSKKSYQARHTGIKIVQQIAILMGCAVLPHLKSLVEIIEHGLRDEQQKVRTITALAIAALAEASSPYGIEAFDIVLEQLWEGMRTHSGRALAAFLKAIGFIIPLMDAEDANVYVKTVMQTLIRMFGSINEDEMKKVVLIVVKQCVSTEGVEAQYIRETIVPPFFEHFWNRKMALDRRNSKQLIETTVEIANKVGGAEIISRRVQDLKDDSEPFRKMAMETIEKIVVALGVADINTELEDQLMDGIIYAFHQQTSDENQVMINGFGAVINCLGTRAKRHFPQICANIYLRLKNKSARVRQQVADLVSRIALVMKNCGEEKPLLNLGQILYENLGEEYPEVLGSILAALKAIVNVVGMTMMKPPIKDLLPSLTPILKNRHEKVQENCIDLVGRIADRGSDFVSPKEWMRICFDLLDLLKAHKKGIRRATVNTFGYIANAIGPQDVLVTLLNNLKVQERQNRVCTTVAIAIVAETCGPFTVLPALMNEYRVPEMNVQNGVLKSLSFMFEYIGEMGKDYIYAVTPLLEDALIDRDLVHRQTAGSAVKHLALGVAGLGCEDALIHLLNYIWPNIFETSPHVINAVMESVEAMRVAIGPGNLFLYTVHGLFHPARRVRDVYWKIYNMLYVGSQDGLTPFYPVLENSDGNNDYTRHELISYFI